MSSIYLIHVKLKEALNKLKESLEILKILGFSEEIKKRTKIIKIVEEKIKK